MNNNEQIYEQLYIKFDALQKTVTAKDLIQGMKELDQEIIYILDKLLAIEYGIDINDKEAYKEWYKTHKPFHWIMMTNPGAVRKLFLDKINKQEKDVKNDKTTINSKAS